MRRKKPPVIVDYAFALKRPFKDFGKFSIAALIDLFPVVNIISYGFTLKCAGVGTKGRIPQKLPEFRSGIRFFAKDVIASLVTFVYSLAAMIPYVWILKDLFHDTGGITFNSYDIAVMDLLFPASTFVLLVILPLLLYPLPMIILAYAKHSEFGSSFDFRDVMGKAFTSDYFKAWTVVLVGSMIVQILTAVPVLVWGWFDQPLAALIAAYLVSCFSGFYMNVFSYTLYGQVFKKLENSG